MPSVGGNVVTAPNRPGALNIRGLQPVPGRVQTNATGTGFKMNPNPQETMRPGDATPTQGAPAPAPSFPGFPGFTTNPVQGGGGQQIAGAIPPGGAGGNMPTPGGQPGAPGPGGPTPLSNYAQSNPQMDQALADYRARMAQQAGKEGQIDPLLQEQIDNLRARQSTDQTERATDQATSHIRDITAGQRNAAEQRASASGRTRNFQGAALDESAQRAAAGAAANIQMNEQQRQDNLLLGGQGIMGAPSQQALQRESAVNSMYGGQMGQAQAGANLGLQQQQLGLQQWQAQNQNSLAQQQMAQQQQDQYMRMLMMMLQGGG